MRMYTILRTSSFSIKIVVGTYYSSTYGIQMGFNHTCHNKLPFYYVLLTKGAVIRMISLGKNREVTVVHVKNGNNRLNGGLYQKTKGTL